MHSTSQDRSGRGSDAGFRGYDAGRGREIDCAPREAEPRREASGTGRGRGTPEPRETAPPRDRR